MEWIALLVAALFALLGVGCLILVAVGLPGTWILLALALVVELSDRAYAQSPEPQTFGWWLLIACLALALFGELLEFLAGAAGTKVGGGSRRGMVGAIVGGILGAILLTPVIPVPLVGTLVGALIGTFCGALVAERTRPDRRRPSPVAPVPAPVGASGAEVVAVGDAADPALPAAPEPGRDLGWGPDLKAALGATTGRLLGTIGKLAVGVAIWIALSVAAFWP